MIRSDNVVYQEEHDSLGLLLDVRTTGDDAPKTAFVHLFNCYGKSQDGALDNEQRHVLDSMRQAARSYAEEGGGVTFVVTCEDKDEALVPPDFKMRKPIKRRASDLPEFGSLPPLPFLFDVLDAAVSDNAEPSEFVVYTNFDIVLQPFFYRFLHHFLSGGYDSIIVNRRTVDASSVGAPTFVAQAEVGVAHPGMDCFVFPRAWLDSFARNEAITGVGLVMRSLLYNLVAKSKRLLFLSCTNLTLHYGDDRPWSATNFKAAEEHNADEARRLWQSLTRDDQGSQLVDLATKLPRFAPPSPR